MPKLGKKQSVLKQGISRKRKGFKGVQKQAKRAASATSERRVNITFVGEDDVVSEMIPPPAIPVSARKIGACAIDTSLWDESIPDDLEIAEGYRLVSMESLRKFVNRVHTHGPCASGKVEVLESTVNRMGISNSVFVKCDCGMTEFLATGDHPSNDTTPRTIQGKDLAALHFSGGASAKHAIMEKVGLTVSDTAKMEARRRDSERIKQAEKRVQDQHKKYRVARRQAKQHNEDLRIRGEGVTYAAGAFGEIEPCNGPKKRKTTQKTQK